MAWKPGDWPVDTSADAQLRIEAAVRHLDLFTYADAHGRAPSNSHASHRPVPTGKRANMGRMAQAALVPNMVGEDYACLSGNCTPQTEESAESVRRLQELLAQLGGPATPSGIIDPPTVEALRAAIRRSQQRQGLPVDEQALAMLTAEAIAADLEHVLDGLRAEIDRRISVDRAALPRTQALAGPMRMGLGGLGAAPLVSGRRVRVKRGAAPLPTWAKVAFALGGVAAIGGGVMWWRRRRHTSWSV